MSLRRNTWRRFVVNHNISSRATEHFLCKEHTVDGKDGCWFNFSLVYTWRSGLGRADVHTSNLYFNHNNISTSICASYLMSSPHHKPPSSCNVNSTTIFSHTNTLVYTYTHPRHQHNHTQMISFVYRDEIRLLSPVALLSPSIPPLCQPPICLRQLKAVAVAITWGKSVSACTARHRVDSDTRSESREASSNTSSKRRLILRLISTLAER